MTLEGKKTYITAAVLAIASFALAMGWAEWTPNFRASYEADDTTPLSRVPPTITGLPFKLGLSNTSTAG